MNNQPRSVEEPRIPIGTLGEFEMRGLTLPNNLVYKGAGSPTDVITMPASMAVRMVLKLLEYWGVPVNDWGAVLGVTSKGVEDYKKGVIPTEAAGLQRLEDLLAIQKALMILIPDENLGRRWCSNPNGYFNKRRPIDVIKAEGTQVVRQYLEGALG